MQSKITEKRRPVKKKISSFSIWFVASPLLCELKRTIAVILKVERSSIHARWRIPSAQRFRLSFVVLATIQMVPFTLFSLDDTNLHNLFVSSQMDWAIFNELHLEVGSLSGSGLSPVFYGSQKRDRGLKWTLTCQQARLCTGDCAVLPGEILFLNGRIICQHSLSQCGGLPHLHFKQIPPLFLIPNHVSDPLPVNPTILHRICCLCANVVKYGVTLKTKGVVTIF